MRNSDAQYAAREHYDTRRERRPRQVWIDHTNRSERAAQKGAKGAIPIKETR